MGQRIGLAFALGGTLFAGAAGAQDYSFTIEQINEAAACTSANGMVGEQWELCSCTPDAMRGSVWGTGAYTTDSSVCAAALHAGAVAPAGGVVLITAFPGQSSYAGTTNNGITTRDWAAYGSSFQVFSVAVETTLPQCDVMPSGIDAYTCACPAAKGATGRVWGYGPYTADSDICSAARHAGNIEESGGTVSVLRIQGLERYEGGDSNGVNTGDWQAYSSSIVFDWNAPE